MAASLTGKLESMVRTASTLGGLPIEELHKIVFCSFLKAGLSLYGAREELERELENLVSTIKPPHRGLVSGKLYLDALSLVKAFSDFLENGKRAVILEEANIQRILQFLESRVGRIGSVIVLDCASIPEVVALASKFSALGHSATIYEEVFVNPVGATRFLTGQLEQFGRERCLAQYAKLLKERLNAAAYSKISTVDLVTHQHGCTVDDFLKFIKMQELFDRIDHFLRRNSVLITSDHGYDVVADERGLYITHGFKERCPLNFSKIALFLVID